MRFDIAALEFESFKEFLLDNFVSSFSKSSFKVINILHDIESIYKRQNEIRRLQNIEKAHHLLKMIMIFSACFILLQIKQNLLTQWIL